MVAPEQLVDVVRILLSWGYGDEEMRALLGGNLLRLARGTWQGGRPGTGEVR